MQNFRCCACEAAVKQFGDFELSQSLHKGIKDKWIIKYKGELIKMPNQHSKLLCFLARRLGHIVSNDSIYLELYDFDADACMDNTVKAMVCQIRRMLRERGIPLEIKTHHRRGYSLVKS